MNWFAHQMGGALIPVVVSLLLGLLAAGPSQRFGEAVWRILAGSLGRVGNPALEQQMLATEVQGVQTLQANEQSINQQIGNQYLAAIADKLIDALASSAPAIPVQPAAAVSPAAPVAAVDPALPAAAPVS